MNLALRVDERGERVADGAVNKLARPILHSSQSPSLTVVSETAPPCYASLPPFEPLRAEWTILSLFCGCGGLDAGFAQQGFRPTRAYDICREAVTTYNANLPDVARVQDLSRQRFGKESAEIILAGAPCQGFSTAGRRDREDPRNDLLGQIVRTTHSVNPRVVVVENVPAALSGDTSDHWLRLEHGMIALGYNVRRLKLDGLESGICQNRSRLFLLCWLGSPHIRVELPLHPSPDLRSVLTFGSKSASHLHDQKPLTATQQAIARHIMPGQKLCNVRQSERAVPTWEIPEVFGAVSPTEAAVLRAISVLRRRDRVRRTGDGDPVEASSVEAYVGHSVVSELERLVDAKYLRQVQTRFELVSTFNGRYRRLSWNAPSPTVDTRFGRPELFLHPDEMRGFSIREAARIQGFQDRWEFSGSRSGQFTRIGNAVPPPMASRLASFVRDAVLKH